MWFLLHRKKKEKALDEERKELMAALEIRPGGVYPGLLPGALQEAEDAPGEWVEQGPVSCAACSACAGSLRKWKKKAKPGCAFVAFYKVVCSACGYVYDVGIHGRKRYEPNN